jgi:hypothetical protein
MEGRRAHPVEESPELAAPDALDALLLAADSALLAMLAALDAALLAAEPALDAALDAGAVTLDAIDAMDDSIDETALPVGRSDEITLERKDVLWARAGKISVRCACAEGGGRD